MIFSIVSTGFYLEDINEIKNKTDIEIVGRFFAYPEAIDEFLEKYKNIELIIISEDFFNNYKKELMNIKENNNKKFIVIVDNKKEEINDFEIIEKEEFFKIQENAYNMKLKKEELKMDDLEIDNTNCVSLDTSMNLENEQINFLETTLGKTINIGLDLGLRALLPNAIEDGVIALKDSILENGFKEGIKKGIDDVLEIGKAAGNILSGNYEDIGQVQLAVKSGGLIDTISSVLDFSLKVANKTGAIDNPTTSIIRAGKNTILDTISSRIENELTNQLKYVQKVQNYTNKWKEAYEIQDFNSMEKAYNNLEKYLEKTMPFENTLKDARMIENLHNLIKNNGKDFNLSKNQIELAQRLAI